jgi:hypothetical protein
VEAYGSTSDGEVVVAACRSALAMFQILCSPSAVLVALPVHRGHLTVKVFGLQGSSLQP